MTVCVKTWGDELVGHLTDLEDILVYQNLIEEKIMIAL